MLRKRRTLLAIVLLLVIAAGLAAALLAGGNKSSAPPPPTSTGQTTSTVSPGPEPLAQPTPPPGWSIARAGNVAVAVPPGWRSTKTGVSGATIAVWTPGPAAAGVFPSRCLVQERPQWLLGEAGPSLDWWAALEKDLSAMTSVTSATAGSVTVTGVHRLKVAGAADALAFDSVVKSNASSLEAQATDLLIALADGTEIHVTCSAANGSLPAAAARGVDSATVVRAAPAPAPPTTTTVTTTASTSTATVTTVTVTTTAPTTTAAPVTVTVTTTTATTPTTTTSGACQTQCGTSSDGVEYRVTSATRYSDEIGSPGVAVGYTITNTSSTGKSFSPLGGGFVAILTGGGEVGEMDYEGGAAGNPRCYDNSEIDVGMTGGDPETYHLDPGQSITMPEMCFIVPAGAKVAEIQFFDGEADQPTTITLAKPA